MAWSDSAWRTCSTSATPLPVDSSKLGRLQQVGQPDAMQHFRARAIKHSEADVGTVLRRIDVHAERARAEGRGDHVDDGVGDRAHVGVVRTISPKAFCTWSPKPV